MEDKDVIWLLMELCKEYEGDILEPRNPVVEEYKNRLAKWVVDEKVKIVQQQEKLLKELEIWLHQ